MQRILPYITELLPLAISLASAIVAALALTMDKRLACRQAIFGRQADASEAFLSAFAAAAGKDDPDLRRALLLAFYRCALYASPDTRTYMNHVVQQIYKVRSHDQALALDELTQELLIRLSYDLAQTWQGKALPSGRTQRKVLRHIPRRSP